MNEASENLPNTVSGKMEIISESSESARRLKLFRFTERTLSVCRCGGIVSRVGCTNDVIDGVRVINVKHMQRSVGGSLTLPLLVKMTLGCGNGRWEMCGEHSER